MDEGDDEMVMTWARELYASLYALGAEGVYVNMLAEAEDHRLPAAHGAGRERPERIERRWDPENLFPMNHDIRPHGP